MRTDDDHVLTLRDIGHTSHPYWTAASLDGANLLLQPGEAALWVGRCEVSQRQPSHWALPEAVTLVVTDRRSVFLSTHFDKGGGWWGFGPLGLAVAVTANVVSHHRAARRSAGSVAIGQARHEWLTELSTRHSRGVLGGVDTFVDLSVACASGPRLIELHGSLQDSFATWFAGLVAWQRLTLHVPRSPEENQRLERYQHPAPTSEPRPGPRSGPAADLRWDFPGDTEVLIAEATRTFARADRPPG